MLMSLDIVDIIMTIECCVFIFLWPLRLRWLLVFSLFIGVYLYIFKCLSNWLHGVRGKWKGWALKSQVNHGGFMTVVALTDRPISVRNTCVIERICSVFVSFHICTVRRFVIRLHQISSLFSLPFLKRTLALFSITSDLLLHVLEISIQNSIYYIVISHWKFGHQ